MRVCFFAKVKERELIDRMEFYKQDVDILHDLGFDVVISTNWREIPTNVDFYFIWWWTWAFLPITKSAITRQPCLVTGIFDFRSPTGDDFFHRPLWERWLMRYTLKRAQTNVFASQLEYRAVSTTLPVTNPVYIPLVVDTSLFAPGAGPRENFVLTVARMNGGNSARKRVAEAIRSIPAVHAPHPEMRFVIAGEKGSDYETLARAVDELGLAGCVEFPGVISREKKIELMQRCKVYLSPSRYEGFGLAILEAMSCGAPVVSSPVGEVPEVVADAGLLVDGSSPEAIAAAVNRYLDDDRLRGQMSQRARQRAETVFPRSRRKRELEKAITEMLAKNGRNAN